MKIRIKGASIRLRLSKTEVAAVVHAGRVEAETPFAGTPFRYALQKTPTGEALSAVFEGNTITMHVPAVLIRDWDANDLVTLESRMPLPEGGFLHLLLEKDFQCLDRTDEDQSDNYAHPGQTC